MPLQSVTWRPRASIRPIAIGIIRRHGSILAVAVLDDTGRIKGWRPPGGGIEFGERAADALTRELREEFDAAITPPRLLGVSENLYEHEAARGHEIVFVFETEFADATLMTRDVLECREDDGVVHEAGWIKLDDVRSGRVALFPDGLLDLCG